MSTHSKGWFETASTIFASRPKNRSFSPAGRRVLDPKFPIHCLTHSALHHIGDHLGRTDASGVVPTEVVSKLKNVLILAGLFDSNDSYVFGIKAADNVYNDAVAVCDLVKPGGGVN